AHLESCPNCATALESARTLERLLQQRTVPTPPAQFTSKTMTRVRRARGRSEQVLDTGVNVALGGVLLVIVAGIWGVLRRSGVLAVGPGAGVDAVDLFGSGLVTIVRRVAPSLPLYLGATAVLGTALGLWWWAERDVSL